MNILTNTDPTRRMACRPLRSNTSLKFVFPPDINWAGVPKNFHTFHSQGDICLQNTMTRGNQRDLARAKNLKKQLEVSKGVKKSGDPTKRMESDAEKMRRKQAERMY